MTGSVGQTTSATRSGAPAVTAGRSLGRTILRNSVAATAGNAVVRLVNLSFTIYCVRLLGDHEWGLLATASGIVGVASVFFELGLTQYAQREIAKDPARAEDLFWNMVALRAILGVMGAIVLFGIALAARYDIVIAKGVLLLASTFVFAALVFPLQAFLNGHERLDLTTVVQVAGQLLSAIVGFVFISLSPSFLSLLAVGLVVMPIQIVLALWLIHRAHFRLPTRRLSPGVWQAMVVASLPFGLTSLALSYNFGADTVILGFFRSPSEVGWYNAAYRMVFTATGLLAGFLVAVTPSFTREYAHTPANVERWVRGSVRAIALVTVPAAAGLSVLAVPIVRLLYGEAFSESAKALAIIVWDIPLLSFIALCGNVTTATNLERPAMRIYLTSTVANILFNVLLIPYYGMMAAAVITVLTDALSATRFWLLLRERVKLADVSGYLNRVFAISGVMMIIAWLLADWPLPVPIVVGAITYGILALIAGVVERKQITLAQNWLGRLRTTSL